MRSLSGFITIAAIAICSVAPVHALQAPPTGAQASSPADAPLSAAALKDLFTESAGLGKEEALVLEEAKSLESEEESYVHIEGAKIDSEREAVRSSNSAVLAACDKKDWNKPGYQQCPGMVSADKALQAKYETRRIEYNNRLDRFDADHDKLFQKYRVIQARLEKIESILSRQRAFTDAVDKCDQLHTLEAQSQCMQKQFDGAGTPQQDYTIDDPSHSTVVVPKNSGKRTPEQAIEEFIKSGPPRPVLRPSGEKKEPPPPGQ